MAILDNFVTQLFQSDNVKDYRHASRLFVGDNFALAPKQGFLYHVFFDLDNSISRISNENAIEVGMLVKSVDLPKFTVDTKTLNSYNRPNLVQNKIKYDPVNIVFHDDNADVVRNFWFDYYHYYYRDADLGYGDGFGVVNQGYFLPTKYGFRPNNNYGYTPKSYSSFTSNQVQQYIKSIRIYSLHKRRFSEYTLVNPMITSFRHGQHQAGSNDTMSHEMTISYEFVLYATGNVSKKTVKGFADIHYDNSPSPLSVAGGGTNTLLGPGGLFDTASDVVDDLSKDPPSYASALFKGFRGLNNLKNTNLKNAAKAEFGQIGMDILKGSNPLNRINIPTGASLGIGAAAAAIGYLTQNKTNTNNTVSPTAVTSNGSGVGTPATAITNGTSLTGPGASVATSAAATVAGLPTSNGKLTGTGELNKIVTVQPVTGVATGASKLNQNTAAQQKVADIPGYSANQAADAYVSTNASSPAALQEAASVAAGVNINNATKNAITRTNNLASSTNTPPAGVQITATVSTTATTTTTTTTTTTRTAYTELNARIEYLRNNPNATLNDDVTLNIPTNQGKVG